MFAKCVSRIFVVAILTCLLLVPATGALAAPSAPGDGATSDWWTGVHQWMADWTQSVLDTLRLRPRNDREADDPQVVGAPLPDGEGSRYVTADDGANFDPDG